MKRLVSQAEFMASKEKPEELAVAHQPADLRMTGSQKPRSVV
jgi:hypothetical protein